MRGHVHVAAQGRMEGRRTIRSDRCGNFDAALGIFRPPANHREGDQQKRLVFLSLFLGPFVRSGNADKSVF